MRGYYDEHPELSWEDFLCSFNDVPRRGIRVRERRMEAASAEVAGVRDSLSSWFGIPDSVGIESVPWCANGFYIDEQDAGKNPFYHAGAFYIQEPSAMLPAELLDVRPGEMVLDLCAAPGGKATRLGECLRGEGLLVANEVSADRARALLRNVELFGIENVVITNETPEKLADRFSSFFDKILVDAPCSGEGMFRRDSQAVKSWESFGPTVCAPLQLSILESAHRMLKEGGRLVYSTCTFNPDENERNVDAFLAKHPGYRVADGVPEGVSRCDGALFSGAFRIWPQDGRGDGHFAVCLEKVHADEEEAFVRIPSRRKRDMSRTYSVRTGREAFGQFASEYFVESVRDRYVAVAEKHFYLFGEIVHFIPVAPDLFDELKTVKLGAFPGTVKHKGGRIFFSPSHSLAQALCCDVMQKDKVLNLSAKDERVQRYLFGETLFFSEEESAELVSKGFILLCVDGHPLGWGQRNGDMLKNEYPAAWRRRR